jgi:hypothetical protein
MKLIELKTVNGSRGKGEKYTRPQLLFKYGNAAMPAA